MRFDQQHIAIVGGSRGIGLAVARQARERGARATLLARDAARLADAAQTIGADAHALDVTDEAATHAAFATLGPIDHVYVAAGQFVGGNVHAGELASFRSAFDARLWGAVHVVRAMHGRWRPNGSLVLTGGVSTDRPVAEAWATAVATAAAEQLARAMALAIAPARCNAIAPGWTDTPMWDAILGDGKHETFANVGSTLPVRRIAEADHVAEAVLFLMANPSITGEVVHVDGGHRLV